MPLLDFLDPIPRLLPEVAAAPFRVIDVKQVDLGCNWKILAEAFLEVYHARTIHPKTLGPTIDTRGTVITLYDHGHQSMLSPVNRGTRSDNRELLPVFEGATEVFLGDIQPAHGIFPNLITPARRPGLPVPGVLAAWPSTAPGSTSPGSPPTGARRDAGGSGRDLAPPTRALRHRHGRGLREPRAHPTSMEFAAHGGQAINYQERRIWHVQAWIDKVIGPERIPEHLRVPDLLSDWVDHP